MSAPNTTPLTYNGYVTQVATMAVINTTTDGGVVIGADAAFNAIIPQMLNYAELRIQRDMDFLQSQTSKTYTLSANTNQINISVNDFVTMQTFQIDIDGTTKTLLPITKEYLQYVYSSPSKTGVPRFFAVNGGDSLTSGNTYTNIGVGPYADEDYPVTITGTSRMETLYNSATTLLADTATTFISTNFPDLLLMASMVYISAYQRNFGRQSDDPAMAQSYENQYKVLLGAAGVEEYRKSFEASAWSSMQPSPVSTPSR